MEVKEADVAVVGGGIAGMVTAVRAAQGGRRVVVLEQLEEERYVCNSRLTGGVFHCALTDINQPPQVLEAAITTATQGTADPGLAHVVAHGAKPAVQWLQSLGVRFVRGADPWHSYVMAPPGIAQLGRQWEGRAGDVLLRTLEAELVKHGGQVLRGHRANELTMQGEECTGVVAAAKSGDMRVSAPIVVLADGGFQADKEGLSRHIGPNPDKIVQRNARTGFGAALRMAQAVGGAASDLRGFYGHVLSRDALSDDRLWPYPWLDELLKRYLVVGVDGQRFTDEGLGGVCVANAMAALPAADETFVICDEDGWQGAGTERFLPPNPNFEKAGATVHRADSLEALARMAGVDEKGLLDQVARYNAAIEGGASLSPTRTSIKYPPLPVRRAPFYALPAAPGITYTMGGVLIDSHARVLTSEKKPIAGLYAVGSTTGGLEGGPHVGYVGGLVKAATTALACAQHILSGKK